MNKLTLVLAAGVIALATPCAMAQTKTGKSNEARNSAPGQQMINNRTAKTAPGNSYNAPGQKMIRARTPGGTPTKN